MPKIEPRLIGECATTLTIVSQLFNTRMARLLELYGLTLGQFSILNHIVKPELRTGTRISDISAAVEVGQPAVTKAITRFQAMDLVELREDPMDKRVKNIEVLPKARKLLSEIRMGIGPDLAKAFGTLSQEEARALVTSLEKLGVWLDENRL